MSFEKKNFFVNPACTRGLTEKMFDWVYYCQLGILNPQLVILYPIADWRFFSLTLLYQTHISQIPNQIYYIVSPIAHF